MEREAGAAARDRDGADDSGPDAALRATAAALERVPGARAVILVEGISDRVAVEVLAARRGRDLRAEGVVVFPMGGAHSLSLWLRRFVPLGVTLGGLCDAGEERFFRRGLRMAGLARAETREAMEAAGFFVCEADLEDEMIRALGAPAVLALVEAAGDLPALRSLQQQPEWRGRDLAAQLRRFFGSGARRKVRYARVLVGAVALARVPAPLDAVLRRV